MFTVLLTSTINMEIKISFFMCCSPLILKDHTRKRIDVASRFLQTGLTILIQISLSPRLVTKHDFFKKMVIYSLLRRRHEPMLFPMAMLQNAQAVPVRT